MAWAVAINMLLTVAQVIGGILSGSLSLIADALHNFSDAAGLLLALVTRRISQKPADEQRTFGYARAEVVGGLINLTSIMVVAGYLLIEAITRTFDRPEIDGWIVVIVAGGALLIDTATAVLTYSMSKDSINIKAAFLHNMADALASFVVIITGTLIILFEWYWTDLLATIGLSIYIVWMSWPPMKRSIRILMQSVPDKLSVQEIAEHIRDIEGVESVAHIHVWPIDEHNASIEARVSMSESASLDEAHELRLLIGTMLGERFGIQHSTIEIVPTGSMHDQSLLGPH